MIEYLEIVMEQIISTECKCELPVHCFGKGQPTPGLLKALMSDHS